MVLGNVHFKTSTNRAPRKFTFGKPGERFALRLELMVMADVGLLGYPNAGKSSFISQVSFSPNRKWLTIHLQRWHQNWVWWIWDSMVHLPLPISLD